MAVVAGVVFDLDDTLYLEREYVRSGFAAVARLAGTSAGVPPQHIFEYLWRAFEQGVRSNTFGLLLDAYPELERHFQVEDLVAHYRNHPPTIQLLAGAERLLHRLQVRGVRIGVLSDGLLNSQAAKVTALGLSTLCSPVVLTDVWGRPFWKPHTRGFEEIATSWQLEPHQLVYVGDNPAKDFRGANELGWCSVRLRMEGQLRRAMEAAGEANGPLVEVASFDALSGWLDAH